MSSTMSPENKHLSPLMRFVFKRLFPWPFLLMGMVAFYIGAEELVFASASVHWPSTPGIVELSRLDAKSDSDGTTYHAQVAYTYNVSGIKYASNRVAFGEYGSSDPGHAQATVNQYPTGASITVYYNPNDPSYSVIENKTKLQAYFVPLFGALFITAGVLMLWKLPRIID